MKHMFSFCLDVDQYSLYWGHIKSNKTKWILGAMAERYTKETGKSAPQALAELKAARLREANSGQPTIEEIAAAKALLASLDKKGAPDDDL